MATNPATAPIHRLRLAGRAMRQTTGTPPRVRPMKRLYMIQRWFTTRSLTGPASRPIASAADSPTEPSTTMDGQRNFNVVTSAMALMKRG